jgi:hypothetical protein
MSESKKTRIRLWNAVTLADDLIARLSFSEATAQAMVLKMGVESEKFAWERNDDGTVSFLRKGYA